MSVTLTRERAPRADSAYPPESTDSRVVRCKGGGAAFLMLVVALVVATAWLAARNDGNAAAALAPAVACAVGFGLLSLPPLYSVLGIAFVTLLLHNPGGRPMVGLWRGPLLAFGEVYYNNLRHVVNLEALRFCIFELLVGILASVLFCRLLASEKRDERFRQPSSPALALGIAVALCGAATWASAVYGMARGGNFQQMLWQMRQLAWLPVFSAVFFTVVKTHRGVGGLAAIIVAAALLRSLEGLYFYLFIAVPRRLDVPYILTHEDSVLFVVALMVIVASLLERPRRSLLLLAAVATPIVGTALVLNGRRLAYVALSWTMLTVFLLVRRPVRRALFACILVLSPLITAYVAAGWNSSSKWFAPVASLRSVDDQSNESNRSRDIENHNLAYTTARNPLFGSGFGHPYAEIELGPSIVRFMPNYRYVAHNSVLWLWSLGGLVGFTLIWLPLSVAVFFAVRSYRASDEPADRAAMLVCIGAVIAYMVQCYGDMGAVGWMATVILAAAFAVVGNAAARVCARTHRDGTTASNAAGARV